MSQENTQAKKETLSLFRYTSNAPQDTVLTHKAQQSCSYMINPVDDSSSHNYYTQQTTEERKDIMLKNLWEIERAFEDPKYVNLESSESSTHGT